MTGATDFATATGTVRGAAGRVASLNGTARKAPPRNFASGIPAAEILGELDRIVSSGDFPASKRNRGVLRYIVECALHGRWDEITAYHIATRVYRRPENFDPREDPIIRIEMARLRRDLEMYYLKSGRASALRISIPRGGCFPAVTRPGTRDVSCAYAPVSPFLVSVLRASLAAWSGAGDVAAAAWQDLLLADPDLPANLHASVLREVGDGEVAGLIVEGILLSARRTT